jgi:hypothetical protein
MKKSSTKPTGFIRAGCGLALAAALLLVGGLSGYGQADPSAGSAYTWDCLTSGANQPGIAYITFSNNYTFKGYTLIAGMPPQPNDGGRNAGGDPGRGDAVSSSSTTGTNAGFVFGFTPINGPWHYDTKGRVIGFFTEILNATGFVTNWAETCVLAEYVVTNYASDGTIAYTETNSFGFCYTNMPYSNDFTWTTTNVTGSTNLFSQAFDASSSSNNNLTFTDMIINSNGTLDVLVTTNLSFALTGDILVTNLTWAVTGSDGTSNEYSAVFVFGSTFTTAPSTGEKTNAISFVGKVVPGKKLTLTASTSYGKVTFRGVPATTLPTLNGTAWNGDKHQDSQQFIEFFNLNAFTSTSNPFLSEFPDITDYPNIYWTTNGAGPGYDFYGVSVVSRQKKIGFTFQETSGTNSTLRSTYGSLSSNSKGTFGKTKGVIEPDTTIKYEAERRP